MNKSIKGFTLVEVMITVVIIAMIAAMLVPGLGGCSGQNPFQDEYAVENARVLSKHIDTGQHHSHYMLTTDKGTFEVDNGIFLNVWNADNIYGNILLDHTYTFKVRGREHANMFVQNYPYVLEVHDVDWHMPPRTD